MISIRVKQAGHVVVYEVDRLPEAIHAVEECWSYRAAAIPRREADSQTRAGS